jgi:hypothetical protein
VGGGDSAETLLDGGVPLESVFARHGTVEFRLEMGWTLGFLV